MLVKAFSHCFGACSLGGAQAFLVARRHQLGLYSLGVHAPRTTAFADAAIWLDFGYTGAYLLEGGAF
jgi:hypothetical protein